MTQLITRQKTLRLEETTNRRTRGLPALPLTYIPHPSFEDPGCEAEILAPMPGASEYEARRRESKIPRNTAPELASLYGVPLLSRDQEQHLFRKMNYLKYRAARLLDDLRKDIGEKPPIETIEGRIQKLNEIEDLLTQANQVKEMLINANMRLVVSMAKRHARQGENFFDLLSDGNMSLIRAVEKFDYSRNFKFSTYASWAILKNYSRSIPGEKHRREKFVTGHEEIFEIAPDNRSVEHEVLASQERATHSVNRLLKYLEPREQEIIRMRAGLDNHPRSMTLEEIGRQFGITKERARQLNARAMKKLRSLVQEQELDLL